MSFNAPRLFEFVDFSPSIDGSTTNTRHRIYSHVARDRHARARHLRTAAYQRAKEQTRSSQSDIELEDDYVDSSARTSKKVKVGAELATLPSPVGMLASDRRDPFESMSSPLRPAEHFLLDHCRCSLPTIVLGRVALNSRILTPSRRKGGHSLSTCPLPHNGSIPRFYDQ